MPSPNRSLSSRVRSLSQGVAAMVAGGFGGAACGAAAGFGGAGFGGLSGWFCRWFRGLAPGGRSRLGAPGLLLVSHLYSL